MSAHRPRLLALVTGVLCASILLAVVGARSAYAQEEPVDRGDPPEVLIQGDGEELPVGPIPGSGIRSSPTNALTPLALDPVDMLIIAAVAVIVLGLITMLVTNEQRHGRRHDPEAGPSNRRFIEATRALHGAECVQQLCDVAATHARLVTGADGAMITLDGLEASNGESFDVPIELVFLANRRNDLASDGTLIATPIRRRQGEIVGLLVTYGGDSERLEEFAPLVEDGYASVSSRAETAALAYVDGLTGIANRRRFDTDLDSIVGHAAENETPVAVAMFDVDDFKTFNDTNGHQAGDVVLRHVAELISMNLRSTDVVYRYGGEEFVALLPGANVEDAFEVVERIRKIVERTLFDGEACQPGGRVTLSVGVAAACEDDGPGLVRAADVALYEAKTTGRNRVVVETQPS